MSEDITILTIARLAHVSHTTVSRALNNSPLVKEETKKKIAALAKQLGYVPNFNAKGLVEKRSFLIGVFFTDLESGTSPSFLVEVINQAKASLPDGYALSIDSIANVMEDNLIAKHKFDGVIVISQAEGDDEFIEQLVMAKLPAIVLNRKIDRTDLPNFATNDYSGAVKALEFAIRRGHTHFGLIKGAVDFESAQQRTQAFYDVMSKAGLEVNPQNIVEGDYLPDSGYEAMRKILSGSDVPSCVFASNDDMAVGAIRACADFGYKVPEDISFIGYDDMSYSKYFVPRITTVRKPTAALVHAGIEALTKLLNNQANEVQQAETFEPTLIVRDSVKNLSDE